MLLHKVLYNKCYYKKSRNIHTGGELYAVVAWGEAKKSRKSRREVGKV